MSRDADTGATTGADDVILRAATDLYALPPAEFTAARNGRAASADSASSAVIRGFRKATPAAWVSGLLVRERTDEIESLIALGESMREAQDGLDRATLSTLSAGRRKAIGALASAGAALATERGHPVSAAVLDEVRQTLQAAATDADAATALLTGRLVRALSVDGFEPVDLDGAVAGPGGAPAPRSARAPRAVEGKDDRAAKRAEAASAALADAAEAETMADDAERRRDDSREAVADAEAERDELIERLSDLEDQVRAARVGLDAAKREVRVRAQDRDQAVSAAERARTAARRARTKADRLADS